MNVEKKHYAHLKNSDHRATLQFRLTALVVLTVLMVLSVGIFVDYRRDYRRYIEDVLASLEEQAHALKVARSRIVEKPEFAQYINDLCAQMNEYISPGHHILVLNNKGEILASTRYHSGIEVEQTLLSADPQEQILRIGEHRLAQVRLKDKDGTTIILAQYLDQMEAILQAQLISRGLTTGATAIAIILLIYLVINIWVIKPVTNLATAAKEWATRNFSARSIPIGPAEFRLLADEFNYMAEQLETYERNRTAELEQARKIQTNLLPTSQPAITGLSIATKYRPADHVAGDLYDMFNLTDSRTAIVILDVCGHGISAALLTGVVKMSLHRRLAEKNDLSEAMQLVNTDLLDCIPEGQFVTACVGIWNHIDQSWSYCAAGHPGGVLLTRNQAQTLASTAPLLGVFHKTTWPINTISLSAGDRVFLYTDGVIEAGAAEDKAETYDLEKTLLSCVDLSLTGQVATVMAETTQRSSGKIKDDATIVALEVLPYHTS
ncbi:MAG TPA: HAMP domain-containing protein [Phycisphaerales bacterium]|nr:HAMP domain-containing protein [Phycisphaerales bacterium]